jgi:hypothetical protein
MYHHYSVRKHAEKMRLRDSLGETFSSFSTIYRNQKDVDRMLDADMRPVIDQDLKEAIIYDHGAIASRND